MEKREIKSAVWKRLAQIESPCLVSLSSISPPHVSAAPPTCVFPLRVCLIFYDDNWDDQSIWKSVLYMFRTTKSFHHTSLYCSFSHTDIQSFTAYISLYWWPLMALLLWVRQSLSVLYKLRASGFYNRICVPKLYCSIACCFAKSMPIISPIMGISPTEETAGRFLCYQRLTQALCFSVQR